MGLHKKFGWTSGQTLLRKLGHGLYLMWILLNFVFVWAMGVIRFTNNKHNISDIVGGWILGFAIALVYATRNACLHKYVVMHNVHKINQQARAIATARGAIVGTFWIPCCTSNMQFSWLYGREDSPMNRHPCQSLCRSHEFQC